MQPDRGIVHTDRRPGCITTIPDGPITLTCQYAGTKYAPKGPPPQPRYRPNLLFVCIL